MVEKSTKSTVPTFLYIPWLRGTYPLLLNPEYQVSGIIIISHDYYPEYKYLVLLSSHTKETLGRSNILWILVADTTTSPQTFCSWGSFPRPSGPLGGSDLVLGSRRRSTGIINPSIDLCIDSCTVQRGSVITCVIASLLGQVYHNWGTVGLVYHNWISIFVGRGCAKTRCSMHK